MKLSLKNGPQTVTSWHCQGDGIDNIRTWFFNTSRKEIPMQSVFNCKGCLRRKSSGVVFGLLFLALAAVAGLLLHQLKTFTLPYMLNTVVPCALAALGLILIIFPGKYLSLTLYLQEQKADLLNVNLYKRDARFEYLKFSIVTFKIKSKHANDILSKIGSILVKYDPKCSPWYVANGQPPFGFPPYMPVPFGFPPFLQNPYSLVLEKGKPEKKR